MASYTTMGSSILLGHFDLTRPTMPLTGINSEHGVEHTDSPWGGDEMDLKREMLI